MKKNGFTLLELLVVIGIIGILVALATVSYSATQKSGRDTRRKQDIVAVQNALEQYYSDPENHFSYPDLDCSLASSYMKGAWPTDPSTGVAYPIGMSSCSATDYCICAEMEGNVSSDYGPDCAGKTVGKFYYCVGNLQ
jgi:prepilin-type N-terminal cleavage/methylation domain-containing protein